MEDEERYTLTKAAIMQLVLKDFRIDVSIPMADAIVDNFIDRMETCGYVTRACSPATLSEAGESVMCCNRCGKKMDVFDVQEKLHMQGALGYGSRYDGDSYSLRLCISCMDELIDSCKISPITSGGE